MTTGTQHRRQNGACQGDAIARASAEDVLLTRLAQRKDQRGPGPRFIGEMSKEVDVRMSASQDDAHHLAHD